VYKVKIDVFEKIFDKFSQFLSEIDERTHDEALLLDLKERWGLFLIENNLNNIEKKYKKNNYSIDSAVFEEIEKNYYQFENDLNNYYYEYDWKIRNYRSVLTKAKNIAFSYNKPNYKYLNGLYLNKAEDKEKIKEAIKLSPYLCIGGYMFLIMENIKQMQQIINNRNNNDDNDNNNENNNLILEIKDNFEKLINNIKLLKTQFEYYSKIIGNLGYNKDNLEISQQNNQKIELMGYILDLMTENKEFFDKHENKIQLIQINRISLKTLIKINLKEGKFNELIIEYFRDYGLSLFILKPKSNNKNNDCRIY
jgi:hypothetical protein